MMPGLRLPALLLVAGLQWLTLTGCGSSITPAETRVAPTQVSALSSPQSALPPVWIISNGIQILGTLAAGGTTTGHFDPALMLPDIAQVGLAGNTEDTIVIKSSSI